MSTTNIHIERLRVQFNTKNIFNETDIDSFTEYQEKAIEKVIKNNKGDGIHVIDNILLVHLKQGKCYIKYLKI